MDIKEYFYSTFRTSPATNGWLTFECPVCGKKKGAIHFERGDVKCWRGCYHTTIASFLHTIMGIPWGESIDMAGAPSFNMMREYTRPAGSVSFPEGYSPLWATSNMGNLHLRARDYMSSRGFNPDVLGGEGWGFCDIGEWLGRIIIPYYKDGVLKYYTGRSYIGSSIRYKNLSTETFGTGKAEYFFNEDALLRGKTYLTEGAIDARTTGTQGLASGGWDLSSTQLQKLIDGKYPTCLIPDLGNATDGEPFFSKALKLGETLLKSGKPTTICDLRPLAHLGKDVNQIGTQVLKTETELTFDNLYKLMYA